MLDTCSNDEMAALIGVNPRTARELGARAVLVKVGRNSFDVKASVTSYCQHLREAVAGRVSISEELKAEKKRFATAQADLKEMERDQKAKVMVDVREYEERWAYEVTIFRQIMMGVPSKMAEAITGVSRHDTLTMEDVMRDALQRCSDEVEAQQRRKEAKAEDELRPRRGKRRS